MPNKVVQRTKIAEGLALVAVLVAFTTSLAAYTINKHSIDRINNSRISLTYNACLEQNARNVKTITTLDKQINKILNDPKVSDQRKARLKESRRFTVLLINALAPVKDCKDLVFKRYGKVPTPTTTSKS